MNKKEWLEAKNKMIGASEIYSLVFEYYIENNYQEFIKNFPNLANDKIKKEQPFLTATQLLINKKYNLSNEINKVDSIFGNLMEDYIIEKIKNDVNFDIIEKNIDEDGKYNLKINDNFHPKACATPDGIITINDSFETECGAIINQPTKAVLELKTARLDTTSDEAKLQYLFQLQQQMATTGLDYGMIAILQPNSFDNFIINDLEYDYQLLKTRILIMHEYKLFSEINDLLSQHFDIKIFFYKKNDFILEIMKNCIDKFYEDFDNNILPALQKYENLSTNKIQDESRQVRELLKTFQSIYGTGMDEVKLEGFDNLNDKNNELKDLQKHIEASKNMILKQSYNLLKDSFNNNKTINEISFGKNGKLTKSFNINIK